jgi:hypothetical protein
VAYEVLEGWERGVGSWERGSWELGVGSGGVGSWELVVELLSPSPRLPFLLPIDRFPSVVWLLNHVMCLFAGEFHSAFDRAFDRAGNWD